MLQVDVKNIIPLTEARAKLSSLVKEVSGGKFFVITKLGKPTVAMVDVDYLSELKRKAAITRIEVIEKELAEGFREYLIQKGYNPDKLSDEEAYELLFSA